MFIHRTDRFHSSNMPTAGSPLQGKESSPQAKSFHKGEKAIQFHRRAQRLTAGVTAEHTARPLWHGTTALLKEW